MRGSSCTRWRVYGEQAAERVRDEEWLERAGRESWVVLTNDDAIRRRPVEREALEAHGVRVFWLTTARLTGPQQIERFLTNINRILQRARLTDAPAKSLELRPMGDWSSLKDYMHFSANGL